MTHYLFENTVFQTNERPVKTNPGAFSYEDAFSLPIDFVQQHVTDLQESLILLEIAHLGCRLVSIEISLTVTPQSLTNHVHVGQDHCRHSTEFWQIHGLDFDYGTQSTESFLTDHTLLFLR